MSMLREVGAQRLFLTFNCALNLQDHSLVKQEHSKRVRFDKPV